MSDGRKAKVTGIAKKAFNKCKKAEEDCDQIKIFKEKNRSPKNAFYGLSKKAKMKVPKNKRKVYQRWFRAKKLRYIARIQKSDTYHQYLTFLLLNVKL